MGRDRFVRRVHVNIGFNVTSRANALPVARVGKHAEPMSIWNRTRAFDHFFPA